MSPLTEAQKEEYVKQEYGRCPYCHEENIESGPLESDGDRAEADVTCFSCDKTWKDVWTLTAIEEDASSASSSGE